MNGRLIDYARCHIGQCCFSFEVHGRQGNAEFEFDAVAYRKSRPARKADEYITALIMAGAGAIAYIIGEGLTDAAAAEKSTEE